MHRSDGAPRPAGPLAAALVLLAALLIGLGLAMVRGTGGHLVYPLDDTYIQMAIARNLAEHGVWGVTRFEFSGAGSSPLWPLVLAGLDRATGLGARLPLVANALAAALVVAIAFAGLARHVESRSGQALTLLLIVVAAPLPALALIGMEHTLACAATLALAYGGVALCAAPPGDDRRAVTAVALLGLLAIAIRYDAASVVVAIALPIAVTRGWTAAAPLLVGGAVPAVAYASMAQRHGWPALPAPILLKQRLAGVDLRSWHGVADVFGGGALTALAGTPALLVLVIAAAALAAAATRQRGGRTARESELLLLVFLIATALHLEFGRVGWLYRYEAHLVVLGIVAIAAALAQQLPPRWPPFDAWRWAAAAALTAVMLHPLLLRGFLASRDVVAGAADLYRHEYAWSHFFQRHPPDGGLIVGDVGAISYFTDMPIVDAGGLSTLELLPPRFSAPADIPRAVRLARERGIRVAIIDGPARGSVTGWRCVAAWSSVSDPSPDAIIWLSAADPDAAAHLARDLRTFAAEPAAADVSLRFADARGSCREP